MHRRHDLRVALLTHVGIWKTRSDFRAVTDHMRFASFFEKYRDAGRVLNGRTNKSDPVACQEDNKIVPQGIGQILPLLFGSNERDVRFMARNVGKIIRIHRVRQQGFR